MSFRVEYKRGSTAPAMFQRQVRFQVDISAISKQPSEPLFAITFTLLSGKYTRFLSSHRWENCMKIIELSYHTRKIVDPFYELHQAQAIRYSWNSTPILYLYILALHCSLFPVSCFSYIQHPRSSLYARMVTLETLFGIRRFRNLAQIQAQLDRCLYLHPRRSYFSFTASL